jgi:hypothetical protein
MTTNGDGKIRIDLADLTLAEKAAAADESGVNPDGGTPTMGDAVRLQGAFAWAFIRRTDPTYTYAQAMQLKDKDLEFVETPETSGGDGMTPLSSPESGVSIPSE